VTYNAEVVVQLKPVVNDPQGLVVRDGLRRLGFDGVHGVRVGKHIEVELDASDEAECRDLVASMCEKLLRNPVIEDARIVSVLAHPEASA
jgi:phosphoribosylformylglycinamidine synthase